MTRKLWCYLLLLGTIVCNIQAQVQIRDRDEIKIRDPFVLTDAETQTYYIYASVPSERDDGTSAGGVGVYKTKDLKTWKGPFIVFQVPKDFWAHQGVWAPEVHLYKGKYYLFVTFTSKDTLPTPWSRPQNVKRATQILVSDSKMGPFKPFANKPHTPEDWMALDGSLWVEDGVPYMLFCHEWIQILDGSIDIVRLKQDLSDADGEPKTLFHASAGPWVRCRGDVRLWAGDGTRQHAYVTDAPFIYRTKTGKLLMLWSSYGADKYAMGQAVSKTNSVFGPWEQIEEALWSDDGGHPMLFKTFDGRLVMVFHQPNTVRERARFFEVEDLGDRIALRKEIQSLN